jgi:hypothetical protein
MPMLPIVYAKLCPNIKEGNGMNTNYYKKNHEQKEVKKLIN